MESLNDKSFSFSIEWKYKHKFMSNIPTAERITGGRCTARELNVLVYYTISSKCIRKQEVDRYILVNVKVIVNTKHVCQASPKNQPTDNTTK